MEPGRSVRIARRSDRRFGVRSLRAASMLVKKTSSLRCTRALLRVDPSRALNVGRNFAIASPSGLILIVSVLAISFLRSRVAHRTQSRLNEAVHVDELVRLLDVFDVPVVSFRIVVVVQHRWGLLTSADECQTIPDSLGSLVPSRYLPDHKLGEIPLLVDDLLTQNKPRPPHRP